MSIGIITPHRDTTVLRKTLKNELPEVEIFEYPNIPNPQKIKAVVLWKHSKNVTNDFSELRLICSLGAGVDHIMSDETIPKHLPVTRIVDEALTISMRKYVLMCVLNFQKDIWGIFDFNTQKIWENNHVTEQSLKVGIMGLGALGKDIAEHLEKIGFQVFGYSFSEKRIPGVKCFSKEKNELGEFLDAINVLINLLPLTAETEGILSRNLFERIPNNFYLVNVGRGAHLVDNDFIEAVQNGKIKGAFLDVFNTEPLPKNHPFWQFPEIVVTPHIASITNQKNAGMQIAENYKRMLVGKPLLNEVSPERGY
jgi:glyoxylate/hydroxypyruvate reductase A